MPVIAFEGPAGCGKTYSLMKQLEAELEGREFAAHQKVQALTFMHGARRRLDAQLREIGGLERFNATTIDSFARRLCQRWRLLASECGIALPSEEQFDETCEAAAALLGRDIVRSWVGVSCPIILVDEAQDLSPARSTMIAELAKDVSVLLAFDEFQCLNPNLRPMPIESWLRGACEPTSLNINHRTSVSDLLRATEAVRAGQRVEWNERSYEFKVQATPSKPLAATFLANAIAWRKWGGTLAVLTPSRGFADDVVELVRTRAMGKHQNGPFDIVWERSESSVGSELLDGLEIPAASSPAEIVTLLQPHTANGAVKSAVEWARRQGRVCGVEQITDKQIYAQINNAVRAWRNYGRPITAELVAMTIQQAKNREFDHVVVIWPYNVVNDDDQRRRLLYNAITRAKRSCLVLVQSDQLMKAAPFV